MNVASAILALALSLSVRGAAPIARKSIAIRPLGTVESILLESVRRHLQETFAMDATILPPQALPQWTFFPPRNRYRGTLLLDHLAATTPPEFPYVVGITSRDISVSKGAIPDWGVFGVAYLSQRPAVVSTFRLARGRPSQRLLIDRIQKVTVHEIGHTLGLNHCPAQDCVMTDACGTIKRVDSTSGRFCVACTRRLGTNLRSAT